mmetsp:Transcript_30211/g.75031  ORF Transcript_30211/g.75031 Transcript_30211/m.75031 type:complete len:338 (-) Transcript_30211:282-1295(-)
MPLSRLVVKDLCTHARPSFTHHTSETHKNQCAPAHTPAPSQRTNIERCHCHPTPPPLHCVCVCVSCVRLGSSFESVDDGLDDAEAVGGLLLLRPADVEAPQAECDVEEHSHNEEPRGVQDQRVHVPGNATTVPRRHDSEELQAVEPVFELFHIGECSLCLLLVLPLFLCVGLDLVDVEPQLEVIRRPLVLGQLDLEQQRRVGRDDRRHPLDPVGILGRYHHLGHLALLHRPQSQIPTLDHRAVSHHAPKVIPSGKHPTGLRQLPRVAQLDEAPALRQLPVALTNHSLHDAAVTRHILLASHTGSQCSIGLLCLCCWRCRCWRLSHGAQQHGLARQWW